MAARKKYKFDDPEVLKVDPVEDKEATMRAWEYQMARQHFKNRLIHQLVDKLTILPDEGTCNAVLQKAEYLTKATYGF